MNFNELSELFLMQYAMGTVRPPPSDARMAAALMPIWSVTKLQTVLMDQTRCIVNNVSSSNSGLEYLVYAQGWAQYKLRLLTQCFPLPCILTPDPAWTLLQYCHICRFCHLPGCCWLLQLLFLLGCSFHSLLCACLWDLRACSLLFQCFISEWPYLLSSSLEMEK